ncbi:IPT/TIG domain-containing protein [Streptomyces sp. NBC_01456]|uniref:IPT/TIG domain-containing protein n=1 Tax=unclassified Streptomyces TaxID=2593676 RepID=UPI003FCC8A28
MPTLPIITSLAPVQGHDGATLTITGTGLSRTFKVNFGAKAVTPTTVTETTVTCVIPVLPPGENDVTVSAGASTSNFLPFYYISPPTVLALSANTGPATATQLTVFGQSLLTATGVIFGALGPGTGLNVVSDTALTVFTPLHPAFPLVCASTLWMSRSPPLVVPALPKPPSPSTPSTKPRRSLEWFPHRPPSARSSPSAAPACWTPSAWPSPR